MTNNRAPKLINSRHLLRKAVLSTAFVGLTLAVQSPVSAADYQSTSSATFSDTTPSAGDTVTVSGTTSPGAIVVISISGTGGAQTLGVTTADAYGNYTIAVAIPANLASGIYVLGVTADNQQIASTSMTVGGTTASTGTSSGSPSNLPFTGSSSLVLVAAAGALVTAGGVAVGLSRRSAPNPV